MPGNPGLREFMNQVQERLKTYSKENLMDILQEWAVKTPPGKRIEFLEKLFLPDSAKIKQESNSEFLEEIKALAKRVDEGSYGEAQGEDDDFYDEEQADESWASEVDEFMQRAHSCMTEGNHALARDAYAMLFKILDKGEESGHLPGSYDPYGMLDMDINEARSSYLLSVYFSSPEDSLATNMFECMNYFGHHVGDDFSLKSVVGAGLTPLPAFDEFLKSWIDLLSGKGNGFARYLLREAVVLSRGEAGIADLARKEGLYHPSAYVEWIKMLEKKGDFSEMENAAREGLENVPRDYKMRARIGEYLARAGEYLGDGDAQLSGFREAFYSQPSLDHLLSLLNVTESPNGYQKEIDASISRIDSLIHQNGNERYLEPITDRETEKSSATELLLVETFLLGGRYREGLVAVLDKKSLGWSYGMNPKGLVLSFFLRLLAGDVGNHPAPNVELMWKDMAGSAAEFPFAVQNEGESFRNAMENVFRSINLSSDEKGEYLGWCIEETAKRVDAIVGEKHRNSYNKAALLLVASAEVLNNEGDFKAGKDLVEEYRMKYHRYSAFQAELRNSLRVSGLNW